MCVIYEVGCEGGEFTGNKQTYLQTLNFVYLFIYLFIYYVIVHEVQIQ